MPKTDAVFDALVAPASRKRGHKAGPVTELERQRDLMRRKRAGARDITIPPVADPERRESCRLDFEKFCRTYFTGPPNPENFPDKKGWFRLEPADMHRWAIERLQYAILYGGQIVWAAPRGGGKDTILELAALWATAYDHTDFFLYSAFAMEAAAERLGEILQQIEINELLAADFPEVCSPIRALEGANQRGRTQTVSGERTYVKVGSEAIILPTIPGALCSGNIIAAGSINTSPRGMRIRGQRPTFVVLTDPQTDETAASAEQTAKILRTIRGAFGGLASHDEPLAIFAALTIIARGDVAHQLIDPEICPEWQSRRDQAVEQWPVHMDLWETYLDLMDQDAQNNGRAANAFYLSNRAAMDEGALVSWPAAYVSALHEDGLPLESSALQHFMNKLHSVGQATFMTEYQNEPPEDQETSSGLTAQLVRSRLNEYPVGVMPSWTDHVTQFIDLGARECHYAVMASAKDGTAAIIDYGEIATDAPEGDHRDRASPVQSALERRLLEALRFHRDAQRAHPYITEQGDPTEIDLTLVDSGWLPDVVYRFCAESGPRFRAAKGWGSRAGQKRYVPIKKAADGRIPGHHWYGQRQPNGIWLWHLDADHWKLHTVERYAQDPGTPGACTLYGADPGAHRRYAKHIVAEVWDPVKKTWRQITKWNHYLDCTAGAHAAASMLGVRLLPREEESSRKPRAPKVDKKRGFDWINRGSSWL
jgi:hypothetical protein